MESRDEIIVNQLEENLKKTQRKYIKSKVVYDELETAFLEKSELFVSTVVPCRKTSLTSIKSLTIKRSADQFDVVNGLELITYRIKKYRDIKKALGSMNNEVLGRKEFLKKIGNT